MNTDLDAIAYLPIALVVMSEDMDIVAASREALSMFGLRLHPQAHGQTLEELSRRMMEKEELVGIVGAATMKLRGLGSSDRLHWEEAGRCYNITVFTLPGAGEAVHYGVYFADITDQIAFEQSREGARSYLEGILDSLPVGIVVMDRELHVTNVNRIQQRFLEARGTQFSLLQLIGASATELFPDEAGMNWADIRQAVIEKGEPWLGPSIRYETKDKNELVLAVSVGPLRSEREEIAGAIRVSEDVTEKTRLADGLKAAELLNARLEGVRQVTITLNHEINNALTTIMGNAQLMASIGEPIPEAKRTMLAAVIEQAERIASVTQQLSAMREMRTVDYLDGRGEKMIDAGT